MPDLAHNLSIMPPFSTMQISSEAFRGACLEMAKSSSGDARMILNRVSKARIRRATCPDRDRNRGYWLSIMRILRLAWDD
jgi:hypothetical protein